MRTSKALSLLGLSMRAGRVRSGAFATEQAIRSGEAVLVILSEDASENTKKKISDMCRYRSIPLILYGTMDELGEAIGKGPRSNLALCDEGLAAGIQKHIEAERNREERSVF